VRSNGKNVGSKGMNVGSNGKNVGSNGMNVGSNGMNVRSNGTNVRSNRMNVRSQGTNVRSNGMKLRSKEMNLWSRVTALRVGGEPSGRRSSAGAEPEEHGGDAVEELLARLDVSDAHVTPRDGDTQASADFRVGAGGGREARET
jgi:hypothetical protein